MEQLETLLNKDKTIEFLRRIKDEEITFEGLEIYKDRQMQKEEGLYLQFVWQNLNASRYRADSLSDQEKSRIYKFGESIAMGAISGGDTKSRLITTQGIEGARIKFMGADDNDYLMKLNEYVAMTGIADRDVHTRLSHLVSDPNILNHSMFKLGYRGVVAAAKESITTP